MDETSQKIINATMSLIKDKGYVATTTKDIAKLAGVNECTLFRKFKNKKDIVMNGMEQQGKIPHLDFECLAMTILSSTFGFIFLNASFNGKLANVSREAYIKSTVATFIEGIPRC